MAIYIDKKRAVKKLRWAAVLLLSLMLFGCGKTETNSPAVVVNSQNQPVVEKTPVENFERDKKLQAETDDLLPLFDNMPQVPVYLRDEPVLKSGTNTEKGTAYTHCYRHDTPTIFVKKIYYQKVNRKQLINALKHELTHAWLCRQGVMVGHDERFRRKFKQVGGFGN